MSTGSQKIQAYVRTNAAAGRDTERIGPFLATFTRRDDHPFMNYAIPDAGARPTDEDVAALVAAFQARGRIPRLEYLPGLAPAVEQALLDAGFAVEDRLPVMRCTRETFVPHQPPHGIELLSPSTDEEIRAMITVQDAAFGEARPVTDESVVDRRAFVEHGGLAVLARNAATADPAGGGIGTPVSDGVSELAGLGVVEQYRRRGAGAAITAWLAQAAFTAGAEEVFLTPAGEAQQRIYGRVGFTPVDEVLYLRRG